MGGKQGKEALVHEEPWKEIKWGNNETVLKELRDFVPGHEKVQHLRFLLYGSNGSGKSSLINSMKTTLLGRMAIPASTNTADIAGTSYTVEYKTHRLKKGSESPKSYYPFVFSDMMGLDEQPNVGIRTEDIKLVMMGHVKDGYKFNPKSSIAETDPYYNPEPKPDDKVHLLICVLNANSPDIDPSLAKKMMDVRQAARDLGVPDIAICTHIDDLCEEIEKDLHNVYKSKSLENRMTEFSLAIGVSLQRIMAVKNYCNGKTTKDDDMDTLILTALRHMVDFGNDFIEEMP